MEPIDLAIEVLLHVWECGICWKTEKTWVNWAVWLKYKIYKKDVLSNWYIVDEWLEETKFDLSLHTFSSLGMVQLLYLGCKYEQFCELEVVFFLQAIDPWSWLWQCKKPVWRKLNQYGLRWKTIHETERLPEVWRQSFSESKNIAHRRLPMLLQRCWKPRGHILNHDTKLHSRRSWDLPKRL